MKRRDAHWTPGQLWPVRGGPLENISRTTSPLKIDKPTEIQENDREIIYPQSSYGLETVDLWIIPSHLPKENKSTEIRGQDGNHAALQGSYGLYRGNLLDFFL